MHSSKMKRHIIKEKVVIVPNKMDYFTSNDMFNAKRIEIQYGVKILLPALKEVSEIKIIGPEQMVFDAIRDIYKSLKPRILRVSIEEILD